MATTLLADKLQIFVDKNVKEKNGIDRSVFGKKIGFFTKMFGCWHGNVSRPFMRGKTAYRSCLQCGARKQFNPETLETFGSFYFPPAVKEGQI